MFESNSISWHLYFRYVWQIPKSTAIMKYSKSTISIAFFWNQFQRLSNFKLLRRIIKSYLLVKMPKWTTIQYKLTFNHRTFLISLCIGILICFCNNDFFIEISLWFRTRIYCYFCRLIPFLILINFFKKLHCLQSKISYCSATEISISEVLCLYKKMLHHPS